MTSGGSREQFLGPAPSVPYPAFQGESVKLIACAPPQALRALYSMYVGCCIVACSPPSGWNDDRRKRSGIRLKMTEPITRTKKVLQPSMCLWYK